jgi:hypothetical protein
MKKNRGCRSSAEINQEYTTACAQLGNFTFRRNLFAKEIERLNARLFELDLEAGAAAQQEQANATQSPQEQPVVATDKNGVEYVACTTEECLAAESEPAVAAV